MCWLSLALYAKSKRTPWVLRGLNDGTAFVGLGFSIDRKAGRGSHVVLGCSHMYNARGEGMECRLNKVENPVWRGKNPFMSHDDAARVGRTIQELYFKARGKLPRRVVIHKRTPFIKSERLGFQEGVRGVDALNLIEINATPLRYVASRLVKGQIDEDRWPVKRGTVVALDRYSALLWIHGVAAALNPQRNYFQGKRRIPSPVLVHGKVERPLQQRERSHPRRPSPPETCAGGEARRAALARFKSELSAEGVATMSLEETALP